jgi:hypothetical protein
MGGPSKVTFNNNKNSLLNSAGSVGNFFSEACEISLMSGGVDCDVHQFANPGPDVRTDLTVENPYPQYVIALRPYHIL